jgi:hypothetical protein
MARAGKKRKQGVVRTKTGQISRAGKDPRMTALAQHHRAGSLSEWRGTTIGRLLEDDRGLTRGAVVKELHEAANRFAKAYEAWRSAMCSRRPLAVVTGSTPGEEDEDRTARLIERYEAANRILQQQGHAIRQATHEVVCDHHEESWRPPFNMSYHCVEGLKALADHYGLDWRLPSRQAA